MNEHSYLEVANMARIPDDVTIDAMEEVLNIASDSTRLKILYSLIDEEKSVNEIVKAIDASQSLVSHQLQILRKADLVSYRKEGTSVFYSLADEHVNDLISVVYEHVREKM